ncbi:MAG TPA: helix-turn-helix transcriptional regulator [Candidatus Acidoferrum sp.]|jgi:transcriptional regulator with XRE-family HTH domain|nr:helix-turn-helix transcriptional regulator [Candidatus Acidoferrum sp.]
MILSERLRAIREQKKLSQGEIEKRTGLKRCYISRIENGHTIHSLATLERMACALEIPLYQFFYNGKEPPAPLALSSVRKSGDDAWGFEGESFIHRLQLLLGRIAEPDRKLLFHLASQLVLRTKA